MRHYRNYVVDVLRWIRHGDQYHWVYTDDKNVPENIQEQILTLCEKCFLDNQEHFNDLFITDQFDKSYKVFFFETKKEGYNFDVEDILTKLYFDIMNLSPNFEHRIKQVPLAYEF